MTTNDVPNNLPIDHPFDPEYEVVHAPGCDGKSCNWTWERKDRDKVR